MIQTDGLRRTALILVLAGLLWNLVEAVVSFWAGYRSGSVALLAFGLDSIIELLAGGILVWRLTGDREGPEEELAERMARRLVGASFFVLAAYIAIHSGANLLGWLPEPQPSLAGIMIVVASAVVMSALYVGKMRIAARMQSRSLRAEALESLFCGPSGPDYPDRSGPQTRYFPGGGPTRCRPWYWFPSSSRKAWRTFLDDDEEHEDHERLVCFCLSCFYSLRTCWAACCKA